MNGLFIHADTQIPTRYGYGAPSLLDFVLTTAEGLEFEVGPNMISDHHPISILFKKKMFESENNETKCLITRKRDLLKENKYYLKMDNRFISNRSQIKNLTSKIKQNIRNDERDFYNKQFQDCRNPAEFWRQINKLPYSILNKVIYY